MAAGDGKPVDVVLRALDDGKKLATTFPSIEAKLSTDLVTELKIRPSLVRLARAIANQMQRNNPRVVGVKLTGVNFVMYVEKDKR